MHECLDFSTDWLCDVKFVKTHIMSILISTAVQDKRSQKRLAYLIALLFMDSVLIIAFPLESYAHPAFLKRANQGLAMPP
jgi:hypothetical protein